jgi:hypothetical protein
VRQRVIGELQNPNGAEAKGARYRRLSKRPAATWAGL